MEKKKKNQHWPSKDIWLRLAGSERWVHHWWWGRKLPPCFWGESSLRPSSAKTYRHEKVLTDKINEEQIWTILRVSPVFMSMNFSVLWFVRLPINKTNDIPFPDHESTLTLDLPEEPLTKTLIDRLLHQIFLSTWLVTAPLPQPYLTRYSTSVSGIPLTGLFNSPWGLPAKSLQLYQSPTWQVTTYLQIWRRAHRFLWLMTHSSIFSFHLWEIPTRAWHHYFSSIGAGNDNFILAFL